MTNGVGGMSAGVLYISYDGMLEPLGQSQVVLAYLEKLPPGRRIHLISFEKAHAARNGLAMRAVVPLAAQRFECRQHGLPQRPREILDDERFGRLVPVAHAEGLSRGEGRRACASNSARVP